MPSEGMTDKSERGALAKAGTSRLVKGRGGNGDERGAKGRRRGGGRGGA